MHLVFKGPGSFITKDRELVRQILQCVMNPHIKITLANSGVSPTTIDAKMTMAQNGWTAEIDLTSVQAGGSTSGASVQQFKIVSDGGDYYNCHTFDGLTAGATIIKVAKSQDLRCILPTATPAGGAWATKLIRTITYTYTYTPTAGTTTDGVNVVEYVRGVVGDDLSSETDNVTPCLNCLNAGSSPAGTGDVITADATTFAGPATLVGVLWKAQADGRAWSKIPPPP